PRGFHNRCGEHDTRWHIKTGQRPVPRSRFGQTGDRPLAGLDVTLPVLPAEGPRHAAGYRRPYTGRTMFESLSEKLSGVFRSLRGRGKITEDNVRDALRQVRTALLEADVNLEVARKFTDDCLQKALGMEVVKTLRPEEVMVKVVYDELAALMGPVETHIPFVSPGPTIILMAGLQGSGKTTTCGKLAR